MKNNRKWRKIRENSKNVYRLIKKNRNIKIYEKTFFKIRNIVLHLVGIKWEKNAIATRV